MNDLTENFIYTDNSGNAQIDWNKYNVHYKKVKNAVQKSDYCNRCQGKCREVKE